MKKKILVLVLLCGLAVLLLTGCSIFFGSGPYTIEYVSNGDGTCFVSAINTNLSYFLPYTLKIPETSPEGETVTAICSEGFNLMVVPRVMTQTDFEESILDIDHKILFEKDGVAKIADFLSHFNLIDPADYEDEAREEILEQYPASGFCPCYYLNEGTSSEELLDMFVFMQDYLGSYTAKDAYNSLRSLRTKLRGRLIHDDAVEKAYLEFESDAFGISAIEIPSTVTYIGEGAFRFCYNVKDILIPSGIEYLGDDVFLGCNNLKTQEKDGIFYLGNNENAYVVAMRANANLVTAMLPTTVRALYDGAFRGCGMLEKLAVPAELTSVGKGAFDGCESLIYTELDKVKYIGNEETACLIAVSADKDIRSVTLPESVHAIFDNAFSSCDSLTAVILPSGLASIGNDAFAGCTRMTSISIPNSVKCIGNRTFLGCSNLTNIGLPGGVISIGSYAFADCAVLAGIALPDKVMRLGDSVFRGCHALISVIIPEHVVEIGDSAFEDCDNLLVATISGNVRRIGNRAFYNCAKLGAISIPEGVERIGNRTFFGCVSTKSISLPASLSDIGEAAILGYGSLDSLTVDPKNKYYQSENGGLWEIDGATLLVGTQSSLIPEHIENIGSYAFYACDELETIVIPEGVKAIGEYAFWGCTMLKEVTIPSSVTRIGDSAFEWCHRLEKITVGGGLKEVGSFAFSNCMQLTDIVLPAGVETIGYSAFSGCEVLERFEIPTALSRLESSTFNGCTALGRISGGATLESIGTLVFYGCGSVTAITLGEGLAEIGNSAFYGSGISEIRFEGTQEQWIRTVGEDWQPGIFDYVVLCTDGLLFR